ncbi:hypothetical protein A3C86_00060 [Candidatus Kaiserbacteria bacterium RIFCSPHIGHO2_02_FULL_49_16]|uniref:Cell shape-determining protein MreC n=1 Tax=Candidatus Kaiserbacteria bacterium RIFCSPHIGHO2_02_FULL_49_16 TaxID=1798490 RepID=A0A1F6DHR8_9BACT|nr:MAG: hypothetical protein A3C86_00060 [Candidatus Kaiserbacteria bacterium RIFCSPHIGHO2_02_FULL_49_16]
MNLFRRNNFLQDRWAPHTGLPVRGTQTGRKHIFIATLIVCALFIVDAFSGGAVRSLARRAGSMVWQFSESIQKSIYESGFFSTRRVLIAQNLALTEQVAQLEGRSAAYRVLQDENANLREILKVAGISGRQNSTSGITAPIISSFRASPYGTVQIGAGKSDAVSPGNLVLSVENFVIGRVETVDEHTSLVKEIFAPSVSTDAVLHGIGVEVLGQGGGNAVADLPRQTSVGIGDPVISAALGSRAIGVVGNVSEDVGGSYKRVHIYLPVNLSILQFVYIVKN